MKTGLGFALLFIHIIVLSTGAAEAAQALKWPTAGIVGSWIVGGLIGFIPFVRTLLLFGILSTLIPWWQAALATPPLAGIMMLLSAAGMRLTNSPPDTDI